MADAIKEKISIICTLADELEEFMRVGNVNNVSAKDTQTIFQKVNFLETCYSRLELRGMNNFLNEYIDGEQKYKGGSNLKYSEISTLAERVLVKFLSPYTDSLICHEAIKQFITYFGENRFECACKQLARVRHVFLDLSSMKGFHHSTEDLQYCIVLESWLNTLTFDSGSEEKLIKTIDDMITPKSFKLLTKISLMKNNKVWKPIINLIYNRTVLKLGCFESEIWSIFIENRIFFQNTVKYNTQFLDIIFKILLQSCENHSYNTETLNWEVRLACHSLTIHEVVTIIRNLLTLEVSFNKVKLFLEKCKSADDYKFWVMIESEYLKFYC